MKVRPVNVLPADPNWYRLICNECRDTSDAVIELDLEYNIPTYLCKDHASKLVKDILKIIGSETMK